MLDDDLRELRTAEEFLDYFGVAFDGRVVAGNRLRLLKRFHDYIQMQQLPPQDDIRRMIYTRLLEQAYRDCRAPAAAPLPVEDFGEPEDIGFVPVSEIRM